MEITIEELNKLLDDARLEGEISERKKNRHKKNRFKEMDAYEKTEYILNHYKDFKKAIEERNEQITDISRYGIKKKSCSITSYQGGTRTVSDDMDKADEQINILQNQNEITKRLIDKIDNLLSDIQDEPYFVILEMYYIEKKKLEVIAGELGISTTSVSYAKKNMIDRIKIWLFADDVTKEIMGA